jgi:hypothetical protein
MPSIESAAFGAMMANGLRGVYARALGLLLLLPVALVAAWLILDLLREAGTAEAGAIDWIAPIMSACAVAPAAMAAAASPLRRMLAWVAGTLAGSAVSILLLMSGWGIIVGVIFAGLQLWQVLGVAAAVAASRAVAGARPGLARTALLVPLIPVTTLVTLVFVAMVTGGDRPLLALAFPAWGITVISAAAAATVILTGRCGFVERVGAWLGATFVATVATVALHGPVVALFEASGGAPATSRLDPVFLAVQLWQASGPVLAIALAHVALALFAQAEDRARARAGFSTGPDAPI